jgi:hypothetical protein
MSTGPTFYGDVRTSNKDVSTSFAMVDILARGKWLKTDTNTVEKFISNLQLVQDAGEFAFYPRPDSAQELDRIVRQYMSSGKRFIFRIWAYFDGQDAQGNSVGTVHTANLYCSGCELMLATGFPQSFGVRFGGSSFSHRARTRSGGHGNYRHHGRHDHGGYGYGYGYVQHGYANFGRDYRRH